MLNINSLNELNFCGEVAYVTVIENFEEFKNISIAICECDEIYNSDIWRKNSEYTQNQEEMDKIARRDYISIIEDIELDWERAYGDIKFQITIENLRFDSIIMAYIDSSSYDEIDHKYIEFKMTNSSEVELI